MFEKNIAAIEKKNPKLAQKLKDIKEEDIKDIEIYESESKNIIISYKGFLLHSNEDPMREAKSIWHKTITSDLNNKDIQIVYGLGIGYLFKRAYVNADSRVFIYEPSLDILRFVFENVDFSTELNDERVYISDTQEDFLQYFEQKYLMGDKVEVLFLPSYLHFDKENLLSLSEQIYNIVKNKGIDQQTIAKNTKMAVKNLITRFGHFKDFSAVDYLQDEFKDKSGLVLAAGPSLQDNIEKIKKNRDKFITIAILPILDVLVENNIEPDFVIAADPWNQQHKIKKSKNKLKNTNLVIEARSDISLDGLETNSKMLYFSNVDKISEYLLTQNKKQDIQIRNNVASVVILGYELAKLLGLKDVTFIGLDLAIIDDKIYADGTKAEMEGESKITITNELGVQRLYVTKVKSTDGGEVLTREDYLIFIKEFEKLSKEFGSLKMYNTSSKGAFIEGMEYKDLNDIAQNSTKIDININEIVNKTIEKRGCCEELQAAAKDFLIEEKETIKAQKPSLEKSIKATEEVLEILEEEKPDLEKFQKSFNENFNYFSQARNMITKNPILSTYMQSEIIEYLKKYNRDQNVNVQKLISNFKCDLDLFKSADTATSDIISLIDKTL